ncbi:MAG: thioredoxin domain-containing protein [Deltaproteobacteria bacterium]|nr:thioredoxin domain-containing protein [Deltaproteobacteria bacterium]
MATGRAVAPIAGIALAVLACATAPAARSGASDEVPRFALDGEHALVPVGDSPCRGPAAAPVTVVEFTDFECQHCARARQTLSALERRHSGEIRLCYKYRTIPLHMYSRDAAEAAEAAKRQGKFWPMHDLLFANQQALGPDDLVRYAQEIGLDVDRFNADRFNDAVFTRVDQDEALASEAGVRGAPTFFFNGRRLEGAQPIEKFEELFAASRRDAETALAAGVPPPEVYDAIMRVVELHANEPPRLAAPIPIADGDPCRGPAAAAVTVVEFTDFECPFCGMAKLTLDHIEQEYGGRLRVCVKMYPMPYHEHGLSSARYALAAHRQGRFFDLYDDLFAHPEALDDISIRSRARGLGLDVERLERDTASSEVAEQIARHVAEARQAEVRGTPTFVVNRELVFGAQPFEVFQQAVEHELSDGDRR